MYLIRLMRYLIRHRCCEIGCRRGWKTPVASAKTSPRNAARMHSEY